MKRAELLPLKLYMFIPYNCCNTTLIKTVVKLNYSLIENTKLTSPVKYETIVPYNFCLQGNKDLDPVVQSIVSLTSSLRGQLLKGFTIL